jgi:hypothetical protein
MPYIRASERENYNKQILKLAEKIRDEGYKSASSFTGQLNYVITRLILELYGPYLPNYADFNEIIGVLECAKLEMYRRHVGTYEDLKIQENGDVKPPTTKK